MDMVMPVMDGMEATHKLREMETIGDVPIIILSANSSNIDKEQALASGANAFMTKPLNIGKLVELIGSLLNLQWQYLEQPISERVSQTDEDAMLLPSQEELESLLEVVNIGNMRDIKAQAALLLQQNGQYRAFVDKINKLANGFRSKELTLLVQKSILEKREDSFPAD